MTQFDSHEPTYLEEDETNSLKYALPFKRIVIALGCLGLIFLGLNHYRTSLLDEQRDIILKMHQTHHKAYQQDYLAFRDKVEARLIASDTLSQSATLPTIRMEGSIVERYRHTQGSYMRIVRGKTKQIEQLRTHAMHMRDDQIRDCMALPSTSLEQTYLLGRVMSPEWLQQSSSGASKQILALMIEEQRGQLIAPDTYAHFDQTTLEAFKKALHPNYFLVTVTHAKQRHTQPVDLYMWDMTQDIHEGPVQQMRVQSKGRMITSDLRGFAPGTPKPHIRKPELNENMHYIAVDDCSIAAQFIDL